jgi:hypothetical protein
LTASNWKNGSGLNVYIELQDMTVRAFRGTAADLFVALNALIVIRIGPFDHFRTFNLIGIVAFKTDFRH